MGIKTNYIFFIENHNITNPNIVANLLGWYILALYHINGYILNKENFYLSLQELDFLYFFFTKY